LAFETVEYTLGRAQGDSQTTVLFVGSSVAQVERVTRYFAAAADKSVLVFNSSQLAHQPRATVTRAFVPNLLALWVFSLTLFLPSCRIGYGTRLRHFCTPLKGPK
jgi:hypothetical protein